MLLGGACGGVQHGGLYRSLKPCVRTAKFGRPRRRRLLASHDPSLNNLGIGATGGLAQLNARSREIFKHIVDNYLATGDPVGSRNISRIIPMTLSPASVRNVMQDLEQLGLIYAPHTSAGRLPTQQGLRFFVDALMEVGAVNEDEKSQIAKQISAPTQGTGGIEDLLTEASQLLSGLSHGAGVVIAQKSDLILKHIEFIRLDAERAMVVLVGDDGTVENRVLPLPA